MKKLLIPFIAIFTLLSVNFADAQSKSELRKAARAERAKVYAEKMVTAIKTGEFNFVAQTLQGNIGNPTQLTAPNNFVAVYGNSIDVQLPYFSYSAIGGINLLNFIDSPITYEASFDGTYYYVTISISNAPGAPQSITQNGTFVFHFEIAAKSGYTTLTLSPQLSTSCTYVGVIQIN